MIALISLRALIYPQTRGQSQKGSAWSPPIWRGGGWPSWIWSPAPCCSLPIPPYSILFLKESELILPFTLMSRYRNVSWTFFQPANRVRWQGGRPGSLQGTPTTWAYDTLEDAAASNPTTSGECSILFKYVYKWHPQILCGRVWLIFLKGPAVETDNYTQSQLEC